VHRGSQIASPILKLESLAIQADEAEWRAEHFDHDDACQAFLLRRRNPATIIIYSAVPQCMKKLSQVTAPGRRARPAEMEYEALRRPESP
jgi:hypothetical protein